MSDIASPPRAVEPFIDFVAILRANGFAVAPEQTARSCRRSSSWGRAIPRISAVRVSRPWPRRLSATRPIMRCSTCISLARKGRTCRKVKRRTWFASRKTDAVRTNRSAPKNSNESGQAATRAEALVERRFGPAETGEALRRLAREAARRLPKRLSYRRWRARRGAVVDLRRTLREATRNDGEIIKLSRLKRRMRPRKALLLIDVSGSMKARTEENLCLAHALVQASPRVEVVHVRHPAHADTRPDAAQAARAGAGRRGSDRQRL